MINMQTIIDVLFVCGMISFLWATIRQISKVYRVKKTAGISLTHYRIKLVAIVFMTIGYVLAGLPLSIAVSSTEFFLNLWLILLVTKYRRQEDEK